MVASEERSEEGKRESGKDEKLSTSLGTLLGGALLFGEGSGDLGRLLSGIDAVKRWSLRSEEEDNESAEDQSAQALDQEGSAHDSGEPQDRSPPPCCKYAFKTRRR